MTKRNENIYRVETQKYFKTRFENAVEQYEIVWETVHNIAGVETLAELEKVDQEKATLYCKAFKGLVDAQLATKSLYRRTLRDSIYYYTDIHVAEKDKFDDTKTANNRENSAFSSDNNVYSTDWLSLSIFDDLYVKDYLAGSFFNKESSGWAARSLQKSVNNALLDIIGKESRTIKTFSTDEPQTGEDGSTFGPNIKDETAITESDTITYNFVKLIMDDYHEKRKYKKLVVMANWFLSKLVNDPTVDNAYLRDRIETEGYEAIIHDIAAEMNELFNINIDYLKNIDFKFIVDENSERTDKEKISVHCLENLISTEKKYIRQKALNYFYR